MSEWPKGVVVGGRVHFGGGESYPVEPTMGPSPLRSYRAFVGPNTPKPIVVSGPDWRRQRAFWARYPAPPLALPEAVTPAQLREEHKALRAQQEEAALRLGDDYAWLRWVQSLGRTTSVSLYWLAEYERLEALIGANELRYEAWSQNG